MGRIALNDARFDSIGKDATKKSHGARGRSRTAPDDCFAAQLLSLDRNPRFSGHDVLEDLVDVSLRQILDPPGPYEGNDVTLDTASVGDDR